MMRHIYLSIFVSLALIVGYNQPSFAQPQLIKQALLCFDQENYTEAQTLIDQAMQDEILKKEACTWYYRGVIYEQLMRKNIALDIAPQYLEEALQAYHKTLSLTPVNNQYHSFASINLKGLWLYYLNRGARYYKVESFEQAIEQFDVCKRLEPNDPYALLYTAIAAHQEEQYNSALEQYQAYLKLRSGEAAVYRGVAHIMAYHANQQDQANEILVQAIQQYPWDVNLLEERHDLWIKQGQTDVQLQAYKDQIIANPTNPLLAFRLGYFYEQLGRLPEAGGYYQQAVDLAPKQVEPICRLGVIYYNQAADIINQTTDMTDEAFQEVGKNLQEEAEVYLKKSLTCFKKARHLRRKNMFIAKHLYIIYKRLDMPKQIEAMEAAIKRMKGGTAVLATLR